MVRSQELVCDVSYINAMVPHHSIATLPSEEAQIRDPRFRQLVGAIIQALVWASRR